LPRVLADGDAEVGSGHSESAAPIAGDEVTSFVEHPVVGEPVLVIPGLHPAIAEQARGIVEPAFASVHEAGQDGAVSRRPSGQLLQRLQIVVYERLSEHQILGRVSSDGELGEADEVGSGRSRVSSPRGHLLDVAGEVAEHTIDLAEGNPHGSSVARGWAGYRPASLLSPAMFFST
jgi:hypothetical protein